MDQRDGGICDACQLRTGVHCQFTGTSFFDSFHSQNVDGIHALEGACSLAANGAFSVSNGNFHIFESFLKYSGANVYLNTEVCLLEQDILSFSHFTQVKDILRVPASSRWIVHSSTGSKIYKGVVLAAPFHHTNIVLPSDLAELVPPQPYVHLHVTLLTTRSERPNPEYFGSPPKTEIPKVVLTTYEGARAGGVEPEFNSISYHGQIDRPESEDQQPEYRVKIFSKERISDEWLKKMFGNVGWVYRKEVCLIRSVVFHVMTEYMWTSGTHIRFYHLRPSSPQ